MVPGYGGTGGHKTAGGQLVYTALSGVNTSCHHFIITGLFRVLWGIQGIRDDYCYILS